VVTAQGATTSTPIVSLLVRDFGEGGDGRGRDGEGVWRVVVLPVMIALLLIPKNILAVYTVIYFIFFPYTCPCPYVYM
jgi:hypothetical protein